MRFHVDSWDPSYGSSVDAAESGSSTARIDADIEMAAARWTPIPPTPVTPPSAVLFIDGVRRVDARVWLPEPLIDPDTGEVLGSQPAMGLCASYGAGVVCSCGRGAHLLRALTRRGLFSTAATATDIVTMAGTYQAHVIDDPGEENPAAVLTAALQRLLNDVEIIAAAESRAALIDHAVNPETALVVVDGPLRGRSSLPRTLGYVKSHRITYLAASLHAIIGHLAAGERTPVFSMGTTWDRLSWYLRLPTSHGPGDPGAPWTGVVRIECAADLPIEQAVELANLSQSVLPRYATTEYKDHRAPQNLAPIAGVERELRRRLGDPVMIDRALRRASFA